MLTRYSLSLTALQCVAACCCRGSRLHDLKYPEVSDGPSHVVCNSATYSFLAEQWFLSKEPNPQQWLWVSHGREAAPVRAKSSKTVLEQGLPVRHERVVAPVSVRVVYTTPRQGPPVGYAELLASVRPVGDITLRQGPPANSAEAVAFARPVVNPIRVSVSRRSRRRRTRQQSVVPASLSGLLRLWKPFMSLT